MIPEACYNFQHNGRDCRHFVPLCWHVVPEPWVVSAKASVQLDHWHSTSRGTSKFSLWSRRILITHEMSEMMHCAEVLRWRKSSRWSEGDSATFLGCSIILTPSSSSYFFFIISSWTYRRTFTAHLCHQDCSMIDRQRGISHSTRLLSWRCARESPSFLHCSADHHAAGLTREQKFIYGSVDFRIECSWMSQYLIWSILKLHQAGMW